MSNFKRYTGENVLDAARRRIAYIFDEFDRVNVSISGGKDSTVLAHLALMEAKRRGRKVGLFFLDEEVMYQATIDQVEYLMTLEPEHTIRYWLQIPFHLTNAVSMTEPYVRCWDAKDKPRWMRKRSSQNITRPCWTHETIIANKNIGLDFYDVIKNWQISQVGVPSLVGIRADESLHRYGAVVKRKGYKDCFWSTMRPEGPSFYPLYDWSFMDIWHYIAENKLRYHAYYDFGLKKGKHINMLRVSSLVHEHSFKDICELPEFEPDTYQKLCNRIKGISHAQETATNKKSFACRKLPKAYKSWKEYRDFLLEHYPIEQHKAIFKKRFEKQLDNQYVHRQQCRQLICADYENNLPVDNKPDPREQVIAKWREIL